MSLGSVESNSGGRDNDLALALETKGLFNPDDGDFFVLTGSYAIEAVTRSPSIVHNDVDVNIFTADIAKALSNASHRLGRLNMNLLGSTNSRLEFVRGGSVIELQFVQYSRAHQTQGGINFRVPLDGNNEALVPTTEETLWNTSREAFEFRVKTLSFAIGTWALRISGVAKDQKRRVRQSDIDHFASLVQSSYDRDQVLEAIEHHPQMPTYFTGSADNVLRLALEVALSKGVEHE